MSQEDLYGHSREVRGDVLCQGKLLIAQSGPVNEQLVVPPIKESFFWGRGLPVFLGRGKLTAGEVPLLPPSPMS